jgi:hypothetical protein
MEQFMRNISSLALAAVLLLSKRTTKMFSSFVCNVVVVTLAAVTLYSATSKAGLTLEP